MPEFRNEVVPLESRPAIDDRTFLPLDPGLLTLRVVFALGTGLMLLIVAVAVTIAIDDARWIGLVAVGAVIVVTVLNVFAIRLSFRFWGYLVRDHDLTVRHGVLLRSVTSVPFNRVQHASLQSGPFERAMGLATIKIFTAGGVGADLSIEGLAAADAAKLQELILASVAVAGSSTAAPDR